MIKTGYDLPIEEVARRYRQLRGHIGMPDEFYDRIVDCIGSCSGLRVLDLGCGDGALLRKIIDRYPKAHLFGADIMPSKTLSTAYPIGVVRADLRENLPFRRESIDLVICSETLEHLVNPSRLLKALPNVLRPGGRMVVTVPNAGGYSPFHHLGWWIPTRTLRRKFLPYEHPANTEQPVDTMYEFDEIRDLIQHSGMEIQRLVGYRYFRYLLGLRGIGMVYRQMTPLVERVMHAIGGQRFAYNLIFLLVPCAQTSQ